MGLFVHTPFPLPSFLFSHLWEGAHPPGHSFSSSAASCFPQCSVVRVFVCSRGGAHHIHACLSSFPCDKTGSPIHQGTLSSFRKFLTRLTGKSSLHDEAHYTPVLPPHLCCDVKATISNQVDLLLELCFISLPRTDSLPRTSPLGRTSLLRHLVIPSLAKQLGRRAPWPAVASPSLFALRHHTFLEASKSK